MLKIREHLVSLIIFLFVFIGGLLVGVVYHEQFTVLWYGTVGWQKPAAVPSVSPLPASDAAEVLELPTLSETIPLVLSDTWDDSKVQELLKNGAVILPHNSTFGDKGNTVVMAHSSGFESFGPYRFAFAKLAELKVNDEFTVRTPKAVYTYRVYDETIVWPTEVNKLPQDDRSTVTLVTCWPIWTNYKRLLVNSELVKVEYSK